MSNVNGVLQVIDAAISESMFNMLEGCIPEYVYSGHDRPPSGSTISGIQEFHFDTLCIHAECKTIRKSSFLELWVPLRGLELDSFLGLLIFSILTLFDT